MAEIIDIERDFLNFLATASESELEAVRARSYRDEYAGQISVDDYLAAMRSVEEAVMTQLPIDDLIAGEGDAASAVYSAISRGIALLKKLSKAEMDSLTKFSPPSSIRYPFKVSTYGTAV